MSDYVEPNVSDIPLNRENTMHVPGIIEENRAYHIIFNIVIYIERISRARGSRTDIRPRARPRRARVSRCL